MNARDFVLSLADQLAEQGRTVDIDEDGDRVIVRAPARVITEDSVTATAWHSPYTGRWRFGGVYTVNMDGEVRDCRTRRSSETFVRIYGTSDLRDRLTPVTPDR